MGMKYRNTGALHSRPRSAVRPGEKRLVQHGDTFVPTKRELESLPDKMVPADGGPASASSTPASSGAGVDVMQYHKGGGFYEIPGVGTVRGKDAAIEALQAGAEPEAGPGGGDGGDQDPQDAQDGQEGGQQAGEEDPGGEEGGQATEGAGEEQEDDAQEE